MATRMATIEIQALILVLWVVLCTCFPYGAQYRRPETTRTTNGHVDSVSNEKNRIKFFRSPDALWLARCKSFIALFQNLTEKLKKHRKLNVKGIDGTPPPSRMVEVSKITRILDSPVYLQCKKYMKHYTESRKKFSANKESNGNGKRKLPEMVTSTPPPLGFGTDLKSPTLVRNKNSFVHRLQERMAGKPPAYNLHIPEVKATAFKRFILLVKYVLGITVILLAIACVVTYIYSDPQWNSKIQGKAREWRTSAVPKTPAEVPLLPLEKARENIRDEQQSNLFRSMENSKYARFSAKDGRTIDDKAIDMPLPRSAQPVTVTRTEMRAVREKIQSEVEDPERTRESLELLGFEFPKNAQFYLANYVDKGYKEWTTNADWPYEETAHQASPELKEVKEFAERSQRLHWLDPLHKSHGCN